MVPLTGKARTKTPSNIRFYYSSSDDVFGSSKDWQSETRPSDLQLVRNMFVYKITGKHASDAKAFKMDDVEHAVRTAWIDENGVPWVVSPDTLKTLWAEVDEGGPGRPKKDQAVGKGKLTFTLGKTCRLALYPVLKSLDDLHKEAKKTIAKEDTPFFEEVALRDLKVVPQDGGDAVPQRGFVVPYRFVPIFMEAVPNSLKPESKTLKDEFMVLVLDRNPNSKTPPLVERRLPKALASAREELAKEPADAKDEALSIERYASSKQLRRARGGPIQDCYKLVYSSRHWIHEYTDKGGIAMEAATKEPRRSETLRPQMWQSFALINNLGPEPNHYVPASSNYVHFEDLYYMAFTQNLLPNERDGATAPRRMEQNCHGKVIDKFHVTEVRACKAGEKWEMRMKLVKKKEPVVFAEFRQISTDEGHAVFTIPGRHPVDVGRVNVDAELSFEVPADLAVSLDGDDPDVKLSFVVYANESGQAKAVIYDGYKETGYDAVEVPKDYFKTGKKAAIAAGKD